LSQKIIKSILGDSTYEALNKAIVKLGTKSVVDITELHDALEIAPKSIVAFLVKETSDMKKDEAKEVKLPWDSEATLLLNKHDEDVYAGRISKAGKVAHEFALCSIPQLAAHLLSFSEMYEEAASEAAPVSDELKDQLKALDSKINALMSMVASGLSKAELTLDKEMVKPHAKKQLIKGLKNLSLKKAGLGPKMPSPPKAGTKVGGSQGITQAGLHGDKTPHSDFRAKPTQMKNPSAKIPKPAVKQPEAPKLAASEATMTVHKSELSGKCSDCKQSVISCACFRVLSKPEVKKTEGSSVTLKFKSDWDKETIHALFKSIKRTKE